MRETELANKSDLPSSVQIMIEGLVKGEREPYFERSQLNPPFPLFERVKEFLRSREKGSLLLHGAAGAGKSVFVRSVCAYIYEEYYTEMQGEDGSGSGIEVTRTFNPRFDASLNQDCPMRIL